MVKIYFSILNYSALSNPNIALKICIKIVYTFILSFFYFLFCSFGVWDGDLKLKHQFQHSPLIITFKIGRGGGGAPTLLTRWARSYAHPP